MAQAENTGNMPRSATTQGDQAVVAVLAGAASWVHADSLRPWDRNPRRNDPAVPRVAESIRRWGFVSPIVVWRAADRMVAGHTRLRAMQQLLAADPAFTAKGAPGPGMVRVVFHDFETEHDADLYALADNRLQELASWDDDLLREALQDATAEDRLVAGWNADEYTELLSGNDDEVQPDTGVAGSLQARFVVPPFTVLDARQGYWQERKRAWIGLGLRSEEGRDGLGSTVASASLASEAYGGPRGGTEGGSIFDPVLTELLVRWFSPPTGTVLDPFAGGSVRGVVTAALGRTYVGLELRQKQVEANRAQWAMLAPKLRSAGAAPASVPAQPEPCPDYTPDLTPVVLDPVYEAKCARHLQPGDVLWCVGIRATATAPTPPPATLGLAAELVDPRWVQGDSNETLDGDGPPGQADFLLTCPPYADLEVYSDDPADISGMPYGQFLAVYRSILAKAAARLRPGRFAAIVVGDVRAPDGTYRNFVSHTIQAMLDAGLALYNEAILVTPLGTVPVRAAKTMEASRKLGKTHQNVLIFVKGDAKAATQAVGPVQFELPEDD